MVFITINKNPDNKILIENYGGIDYLSELKIKNNNIRYCYCRHNYHSILFFSVGYYCNEKCHYYKRFLNDYEFFSSYYTLYKNCLFKQRDLIIKIITYNIIFYSYFIYNKYYTNGNTKHYMIMKSITSIKLFNCRDFYKIHSYI